MVCKGVEHDIYTFLSLGTWCRVIIVLQLSEHIAVDIQIVSYAHHTCLYCHNPYNTHYILSKASGVDAHTIECQTSAYDSLPNIISQLSGVHLYNGSTSCSASGSDIPACSIVYTVAVCIHQHVVEDIYPHGCYRRNNRRADGCRH